MPNNPQVELLQRQHNRIQGTQRWMNGACASLVVIAITAGAIQSDRGLVQYVDIIANDPPIGTIMAFAGHWPKDDKGQPIIVHNAWCLCEGGELNRDEFNDLSGIINGLYGNASSGANFKLPDLPGMFLRGVDTKKRIDTESDKTRFPQPFDLSEKDRSKRLNWPT